MSEISINDIQLLDDITKQMEALVKKCYPLADIVLDLENDETCNFVFVKLFGKTLYFIDVDLDIYGDYEKPIKISLDEANSYNESHRIFTCRYSFQLLTDTILLQLETNIKKGLEGTLFVNMLDTLEKYQECQKQRNHFLQDTFALQNVVPDILKNHDPHKLLNNVYNHFSSEGEYETAKERFNNQTY